MDYQCSYVGCPSHSDEHRKFLLKQSSDAPTPEKQAEQIMAIYPIIPGQKPSDRNIIPPSPSAGKSHTAGHPASEDKKGGDLIDFGPSDPPAAAPPQPSSGSKEIASMLKSTGREPEGPLIDFTGDMKKDLPAASGAPGLKRGDTTESNDNFFDAQG